MLFDGCLLNCVCLVSWLVGWLNVFNAELSPKTAVYWRGARTKEVSGGDIREIIPGYLTLHHPNGFCIQMGSDERSFNVSLIKGPGGRGEGGGSRK